MCANQLPPVIIAPFITDYNKTTGTYTACIPTVIEENLNNPNLTEEVTPDKVPGHTKFNLIPTHAAGKDDELTVDKLIEREFGSSKWQESVNKVLMSKGLVQNAKDTAEDAPQYSKFGRDDNLFSVRIDNLPDNDGRDEIADIIRAAGCRYFDRVIVPYDEESGTYKRFGFVKFTRLRHALKFVEDYPSIRCGTMLLNVQLVA